MNSRFVEIDHKDRDQMLSRRQARRFALQVLFCNEYLKEDLESVVNRVASTLAQEINQFSQELITKTHENKAHLDVLILRSLRDRDYERVATLEKVLIRMAVSELLYFSDIPIEVTINEALELSKEFISFNSSRFINGILDAIFKNLARENKINKNLIARIPSHDGKNRKAPKGMKK